MVGQKFWQITRGSQEPESLTWLNFAFQGSFQQLNNLAKPYRFGYICEKLLSNPYVLFLVPTSMLFNKTNISTSFLCRIPKETFIQSWVPIGQVWSKEKIFERNNIQNSFKKCRKRTITPTWLNGLNGKINF